MYLPVLTSGPSSVAWSPDSREVIYSMGGALWRQRVDSNTAQQITDGAGYDYQPDWSADGKSVVYVSYQHDAMELWLLDLASGNTKQITKNGAVNVEPRWSPDGKQIAFVSTSDGGRFHIFNLMMEFGTMAHSRRSLMTRRANCHATTTRNMTQKFNPTWSRDGKRIAVCFESWTYLWHGRILEDAARSQTPRRGRFTMKRRRGRRGRIFRRMGRRFYTARIWGGSGISFG